MPVFKAANTETVLIKAELCLLTTKESALTYNPQNEMFAERKTK